MALKVELKPHERIILGQVVVRNGDTRAKLFVEGRVPILREKDILTAETADTPAKRIYLAVQLMYLAEDIGEQHKVYFQLVHDFLGAAPSALPIVDAINNQILSGELYKALKETRRLVAYEAELLAHATGSPGLR
ncbi:flagellar biosynthesis repressor FlbT [Salinarimonas soli]|uniref:Flagellar biosynthesis repressor FlbT n=1 Tax=Salinarimonas soli TaxID=1638099 RepID=A0A5B2W153_9HYPH|nr:flagellar biosynthesis repressor FlbT [Salinarimonas soli]KAA2244177.1 flagellar biosynthesis repressor FlbT [Salinarimonas soli]